VYPKPKPQGFGPVAYFGPESAIGSRYHVSQGQSPLRVAIPQAARAGGAKHSAPTSLRRMQPGPLLVKVGESGALAVGGVWTSQVLVSICTQ